jgi:hypothetical protein
LTSRCVDEATLHILGAFGGGAPRRDIVDCRGPRFSRVAAIGLRIGIRLYFWCGFGCVSDPPGRDGCKHSHIAAARHGGTPGHSNLDCVRCTIVADAEVVGRLGRSSPTRRLGGLHCEMNVPNQSADRMPGSNVRGESDRH